MEKIIKKIEVEREELKAEFSETIREFDTAINCFKLGIKEREENK